MFNLAVLCISVVKERSIMIHGLLWMTAVVHGAISGRGRVSTVGQHICVRDPLKYTVVF